MSSTTTTMSTVAQNSLYAEVYAIANRNYVGSWADADDLYTRLSCAEIMTELRTIVAGPPSKANKKRATELMDWLKTIAFGYNSSLFGEATAMVEKWTAKHSAKNTKAAVKNNNVFATLDNEEEDDE